MPNKTADDVINEFLDNEYSRQARNVDEPKKGTSVGLTPPKESEYEVKSKADQIVDQFIRENTPRSFDELSADEKQARRDARKADAEAAREPGTMESIGTGVTAGLVDIASSASTLTRWLGETADSDTLRQIGKDAERYWDDVNEEFEAHVSLQGDVVSDPGLMLKPAWWGYHVARMVPSLAASIIPGAAAYKGIKGSTFVAKYLTPGKIDKLAKLGGAMTGGFAGGALEASGTYKEVLERGGSPEDAGAAAQKMWFASAALNALSIDRFLTKLPNDAKGRAFARFMNGVTEGLTEYLEGPAEASILLSGAAGSKGRYEFTPEEFGEQIRKEANVIGPAFLLGMVMPVGALTGTPKKEDETPEETPPSAGPTPSSDEIPDQAPGIRVDEDSQYEEVILQTTDPEGDYASLMGTVEPDEEITMEATPAEQMEFAESEVDNDWGSAFDKAEYDENWDQDTRDVFDLMYEATEFNPAAVDDVTRMAMAGASNEEISDYLTTIISEAYYARYQQAQQQGLGSSEQVSGQPAEGAPTSAVPETTVNVPAGPEGGAVGLTETPAGQSGPDEGLAPPADDLAELEGLVDAELDQELADAEEVADIGNEGIDGEAVLGELPEPAPEPGLAPEGQTEALPEEPADEEYEAMSEDDIGAMLDEAEEEALGPAEPEKPEVSGPTGGGAGQAGDGEGPTDGGAGVKPEPEALEPAPEPAPEPERPAEPAPEEELEEPDYQEAEEQPAEPPAGPEDRRYSENDYSKLKGRTVNVAEEEGGEGGNVPADVELRSIDNRLDALKAFRECMSA